MTVLNMVEDHSETIVSEDDKKCHPLYANDSLVRKIIQIPDITKSLFYKFYSFIFFCKKVQWDFRTQLFYLLTLSRRYHHHVFGPTGNSKEVQTIHSDTYITRDQSRNTSPIIRIMDKIKTKLMT